MTETPLTFASLPAAIAAAGGLFVGFDRDGTLIEDCGYGVTPEQVVLKPGLSELYASLCSLGYPFKTAVFTNQSAIGRGLTDWETVDAVNKRVARVANETVGTEWLTLDSFFVCPHAPDDRCACRKPGTLLFGIATNRLATQAWPFLMFGDRGSDCLMALHVGGVAIKLGDAMLAEVGSRGLAAAQRSGQLEACCDLVEAAASIRSDIGLIL